MNVKLKRLFLPLLRAVRDGKPPTFRMRSAARQAIYLIEKPVSLKKTQAKVRQRIEKQSSRASHNQETDAIKAVVWRRADSICESTRHVSGIPHGGPLQLDHWLGGTGRRRQMQSVETTWALCVYCHHHRTRNWPSAEWWNNVFRAHCEHFGYPVIAHIIHAEPAKAGGAP